MLGVLRPSALPVAPPQLPGSVEVEAFRHGGARAPWVDRLPGKGTLTIVGREGLSDEIRRAGPRLISLVLSGRERRGRDAGATTALQRARRPILLL